MILHRLNEPYLVSDIGIVDLWVHGSCEGFCLHARGWRCTNKPARMEHSVLKGGEYTRTIIITLVQLPLRRSVRHIRHMLGLREVQPISSSDSHSLAFFFGGKNASSRWQLAAALFLSLSFCSCHPIFRLLICGTTETAASTITNMCVHTAVTPTVPHSPHPEIKIALAQVSGLFPQWGGVYAPNAPPQPTGLITYYYNV